MGLDMDIKIKIKIKIKDKLIRVGWFLLFDFHAVQKL